MHEETERLQMIVGREIARNRPMWVIQNSTHFFGRCECDIVYMTEAGLLTEVEVKRTTSDAVADARKKRWRFMESVVVGGEVDFSSRLLNISRVPNRFYMAAPAGVIRPQDLHPWAGLIHINTYGKGGISVVKSAPLLHRQKADFAKTMKYLCRRQMRREFGPL